MALAKTFTLQVAKSANVTNQSGMTATENIAVNSGGFVLDTLTGDRKSQNAPRATAASASGHPLTVASAKQLSKAPGIKGKLGVWHRNGFFQVTLAPARTRCRTPFVRKTRTPTRLHVARGWKTRRCPTCKALPGEACRTPSGHEAFRTHEARLRPGRGELLATTAVWEELTRRRATIATVPFSGRAGRGGQVGTIVLSRLDGDELVDVERWTRRDELAYALEAPVWDRFASFAGYPQIAGTVTWTTADRRVLIEGRRGGEAFEEFL